MKAETRKRVIADYKKRTSVAGIYALRCGVTGEVWVGPTLDLDKIQNSIWFSLRTGSHINRGLQDAWSTYGDTVFSLEVLERLEEEETPYLRDALLKERVAHWRAALNASAA